MITPSRHSFEIILFNKKENIVMKPLQEDKLKPLKEKIKHFVSVNWDEEMGEIKAQQWVDFILNEAGSFFYNQGIDDAKKYLSEKWIDLDIDLESFKKTNRS
jgi:uncharacterized protein (DUF2164 family)